jgi:hypothetical protein
VIRFVDLTEDPNEPICAFLSTKTGMFVLNKKANIFAELNDVKGLAPRWLRERCLALVPEGFFDPPPVVCPGCHAVNAPCAPGCIDAEIEKDREERREREDLEPPDSLGLIDDGSEF